jgi:hypothetical protein
MLPGWAEHNPLKEDAKRQLHELAVKIAQPPFNMAAAASHLKRFVVGTLVPAPVLDVSYCLGAAMLPRLALSMAPSGGVPVDLEPTVKPVSVNTTAARQPGAARARRASPWANFVYPLAMEAIQTHGISWPDAVDLAEKCWQDGGHALPPVPAAAEEPQEASDAADEHEDGDPEYQLFDGAGPAVDMS